MAIVETMQRRRRRRGGRREGLGQPKMGPVSNNELQPGLVTRMIPVSENEQKWRN